MTSSFWTPIARALALSAGVSLGLGLAALPAAAQSTLPAALQSKADAYKDKLTTWAANPVLVAAVKAANAKGPITGMSNGKWNDLDDKDPMVTAFESNPAGVLISKWEADKSINKLVLRDEKGNLVAASLKPIVFNNATRPSFMQAIKGQPWSDKEIKPDPSTGVKGVLASVPVMDGGKVVGVLHTSITAE